MTHTPPEKQATSDDAPDLEQVLASYFAAGQARLQQVRVQASADKQRRHLEQQARVQASISRNHAWASEAIKAYPPRQQFAETDVTALADTPTFPEALKWKVSTVSPSHIRIGLDGWNFRHDTLPTAESSDWQARLCQAGCSILNAGKWFNNFTQGTSVWVRPAQPGPQTLRPENHMALLAGILGSQLPVPPPDLLFCGALDNAGNFLPLRNPLAVAKAAKAADGWAVVPAASFDLVKAAHGRTLGVGNACDLMKAMLRFRVRGAWAVGPMPRVAEVAPATDLAHVAGQKLAKRALEIAVAGGHDLLLVGPPGEGKSLLASCLPGIAPPLTRKQALEVAAIWHGQGMLAGDAVPSAPPLRMVDASVSAQALVGGGSDEACAGEVSLAHLGFLFFDEFLQLSRAKIEALRTPLQEGRVTISRTKFKLTMPAQFTLVAASNPCPCGGWTPGDDSHCTCGTSERKKYAGKLSQPMCDRIELRVFMEKSGSAGLRQKGEESSAAVRERVVAARALQAARYEGTGVLLNARVSAAWIDLCEYSAEAAQRIDALADEPGHSRRGSDNLVKVAQTIADLAGSDRIELEHVLEAEQFMQTPLAGAQ